MSAPLVSILIPNYNHSQFLDECLRSAFSQTYSNIEVILLDNQSSDHSLAIAREYEKQGLLVNRNIQNIMNLSFSFLGESLARGEYFVLLGADDVLNPRFVEKTVAVMERFPNVGYAHCERDFCDENGAITELEPFFKCSFVAPGRKTMPIYMLTTIAHSAQGLVRRAAFNRIDGYSREVDHLNADKSLWFYLSSISDYAYIREKLCRIRVSSSNETALTVRNFQHPILCHMVINEFARYARQFGFIETLERKDGALKRLAVDCLGYAGRMLLENDFAKAESYLTYSQILDKNIIAEARYQKLMKMCREKHADKECLGKFDTMYSARKRNYDPPDGYQEINPEDCHA